MNKKSGPNYSFNSFVVAAENQSFTAVQSLSEAECLEQFDEEDEYGLTSSPETLELLQGLLQKACEALTEVMGEDERVNPTETRSVAEKDASQRLRDKATLDRKKLPMDLIAHHFGDPNLVPLLVRALYACRKIAGIWPGPVDTGLKRLFKEFPDDEQLCTKLALRFTNGGARIFCNGSITADSLGSSPSHALPLIWSRSEAAKYPSLSSFKNDEQKGLYKRGVYWCEAYGPDPGNPSRYNLYVSVGSGRSAKGGMLYRAVQHAENPTSLLYKHLNRPGTGYRIYSVCEWPAISVIPSKEETYDEILLVEALCQLRFRSGYLGRRSRFFKAVQDTFDDGCPEMKPWIGLNVDSALEKPRKYSGAANRSFS
ncbi:hypothetical protein L207DRAFT_128571 [Hyaloscypha variabilis F]|uniref:Uncharacterized protein n=1 Tax=Hyaloscypha variabilis (strain UAMH 11265 / GT02V1 / F) TaxID=1149755 RepID=A0A2J6R8P6_HYAVF|nr:hypothetical protein L207DRAFT_128571 [Hyaloscypha variabilis F]